MTTLRLLKVHFPKVIADLIYDILSHGILDSHAAAKYGVIELIKYPESALDNIAQYCSLDVIKELFHFQDGYIHVEQMYDAIYYALINGRMDMYNVINYDKIKKLPVNIYTLHSIYEKTSKETFHILKYKYKAYSPVSEILYKYDRADLFDEYKDVHSIRQMIMCNADKMLLEYSKICGQNEMVYINAYFGDEKAIQEIRSFKDIIVSYILIKNKIFTNIKLHMKRLVYLLNDDKITPEEFVDILYNNDIEYDVLNAEFHDMVKIQKIKTLLFERNIANKYDIFNYEYYDEIDMFYIIRDMDIFCDIYNFCDCEIIFSIAAFHNKVWLMKRMMDIGARNYLQAAVAAAANNAMDAYIFVKPFLTDVNDLFACAVHHGSHYIILDMIDEHMNDAEANDLHTYELLGQKNIRKSANKQYPIHYSYAETLYDIYVMSLGYAEEIDE